MADTSLNSILQNLDKSISSISSLTAELLANPLATIEDLQKAIANMGLQEQASIDMEYGISDLQDFNTKINDSVTQITGQDITATVAENQQGIPTDLLGICKQDNFQGVRFYDGVGYGYLRVLPDKVELLVGKIYEYEIDTSVSHVYRITGKDKDIKLYIDGELVIDATGEHVLKTDKKLLEFGAISSREQSSAAGWQNFKYSVSGPFEPSNNSGEVLAEIMSFPEGGISAIKSYNGKLYVAYEPDDPSDSGCIYRFEEGHNPENRATLALTKSNVTCVVVDPNRSGNLFGSSGKFIGTDRGIQYLIGSKPYPWDFVTDMNKFPQESGWTLFENCTGNCYSLFDRVLTIDTRTEQNQSVLKFGQIDHSFWEKNGSNALGWSVEVRVKISNDDVSLDRTDAFNTPTDYVFILDNSSPSGDGNVKKYRDYLFETFLSSLNEGDNFAVIVFNDAQTLFQSDFVTAIGENIASARTFIQNAELPFGGSLVENAFNTAFGLTYVNTNKKIVFIGSGQMTDSSVTDVSPNIKAANDAGPKATIYSISIGNGIFNTTGGSNKKKAYREIAEFNSGKYYQIQDVDAIEQKASEIWLAVDPDYFDWLKNTTPRTYALDPRAAFVQNADKSCLPGLPPATVEANTPPPEDGINAPAILINDGVFEEVVQFFEKGIRLKYAKTFARIDLASDFTTVRIIGKDRSIAVFAKADNEPQFKQVLYSPNSLFVRASKEGNQDNPCLAIDSYGITHAAWADSKNDNWNIYYSKKLAANISASGKANTISQKAISYISDDDTDTDTDTISIQTQDTIDVAVLSILNARIAFGLSPSSISNVRTNSIVSANGNFMSAGVQTGDTVVLTNLINDKGERVTGVRNEYTVASVPDEAILVLDTTEDLNSIFNIADFYVYRGAASWTTPVLASNQPMDSTYPFILTHSSGDIYIAYENNSAGASDIYIRRGQSGTSSTSFVEVARVTHGTGLHRKPRMAELAGGNILLVWENDRLDLTKSQIYYVIIDPKSFGSVACYDLKSLTPDSTKAKNPAIASCGGKIATVVYEDTTNLETGKTDVFVTVWDYDNYDVAIKQLSTGDGNNYNPYITACGDKVKIVWENNESGLKEIMFAEGFCSAYSVMSTTTDFTNTGTTLFHQNEVGFKATSYGKKFDFTDFEVNGGASHAYFSDFFGLNAIDTDASNRIMTLAIKEYEVGISGIGEANLNAGAILITGHDADYHGVTPNSGPRSFVQKAISYVTKGKANPRLLYVTSVQNPGGDEIFGAQTLTLLGYNYDIADAFGSGPFVFTGSTFYSYATVSKTALDLRSVDFGTYDAIVVASDYGAWLRQEEVDVLITRKFDLIDFINKGGGLLAFSEGGSRQTQPPFPWRPDQSPAYPGVTRNRFGFLPFIESDIKLEDTVVVGDVAFNKVIQRITNSRGDSTNPSITCNANGDIYIAYENDRVRKGIPKVYISYYNPRTNEWISSNKNGIDTRVEISLPEVSKPQVLFDDAGKATLLVQSLDQNNRNTIASVDIDELSAGNAGNQKSTTLFGPNEATITAAIESGHSGTDVAANAFDGDLTTYWASDLMGASIVNSSYVGQYFSEKKEIARVQYYSPVNRLNNTSAIKVQFSDDGITWTDAIAYTNLPTSGDAWVYLDVPKVGAHLYWRIIPTEGTYTGYTWNIIELQMMSYVNPEDQNARQDNPVVAYFPLEDNLENSKQVINRIRDDSGLTINGVSSENTNFLSVNSPTTGVSWFNPDSEKAFDLNVNGRAFSIDSSYIKKTGAIDLWMTPHWASTDTSERIIFGNDDVGATNVNKISLGIIPIAGGSALKLRIVDSNGTVRETSVENNISETNYSWASGESVHLRSVWDEASIGISSINAISFADSTLGLAVGSNGVIFRTTDGGITWVRIISGLTYDLYSVDFLPDELTAFISGELGSVMSSSDGGLTWQINTNDFTEDLKSIFFNSVNNSLYVAGTSGFIAKSIDNGLTWTESSSNTNTDINSIGIMSDGSSQSIIAVGRFGTILVSTDDGDTFDVVTTKFNVDFYSVSRTHQTTSHTTYITGDEGTILKTSDLGISWFDCSFVWTIGYQPKIFSVSHNDNSDKVYVCGANGTFAASSDGGVTWVERITLMLSGSYNSIDAWKGGIGTDEVVLAGTGGSVLSSPDAGSIQNYYLTKSGNLAIYINGKEPKQVRVNDGLFTWQPDGDLFFGDYKFGGTKTVNSILDEVIIYRAIPNGSVNKRRVELTKQFENVQKLVQPITKKRIEFGSISPLSKSRSHWSQFNIFVCGAKEPIRHFQWTAQLGVQDDIIRDLTIDSRGFLWAATENGLCQFDINEVNDDIERWINGLYSKANGPKKFQNYNGTANGFISNSVNCVMVDIDGDIWAGTENGLLFLDREEIVATSTKDPVAQVKEDASKGSTTNTDNSFAGGDVVNKADVKWTKIDNLASNKILSLATDLAGTILVGTDSGISVIKKEATTNESMTITNYGVLDGLVSNIIQTITYDRKTKEFWIGTDKGISRFDKLSSFNSLTASDGLVSNNVFSIAIKDDKKYVGTDNGLTVFEGNHNYSFLPSSGIEHGVIQDSDVDDYGSIWLATSSGLIQLDEGCGNRFVTYDYNDGIVGDPNVIPYQRYRILGDSIPKGACDKALIVVSINNNRIISGYKYNLEGPFIIFDEPKSASDKVEVCINPGWRLVKCFNNNGFGGPQLATIETDRLSFNIYRKVFSAGTVTLGGNHADGSDTNSSMYFVLAAPLTGTGNVIVASSPASTEIREDIDKESVVYTNIDEKIAIVPTSLRLMQYIATSTNDEKNQSNNDYLSFELSSDAMVYVAYDTKATSLPGWLREWTPVQAIYQIVDMDVYTDASGVQKLFVALAGTNGCVYEVLGDTEACNISDSIALDSLAPDGCATITKINSPTSVTLSLTAQDAVTGVSDMQVSTRSDFSDVSWIPFTKNYILSIPPTSMTDVTEVITTETILTLPSTATFTVFHIWNDKLLVGTKDPGSVYQIDSSTMEATLLFNTSESTITSLATFGKYLLVGTGINGRAFTWDGTTLLQIIVPGGERISSIAVFDSRAFFGTFPEGKIYEMDEDGNISLFMDTNENSVNGFAVFDSKLFWVTSNEQISEGDLLTTTTTKSHRHSIIVPSGATLLENLDGTTNTVDEHSHVIDNGVVQETNGHTHYLNGSRSGKVFRYDPTSGDTIIIHSDKDYAITSIVSDTITNSGLMFVGTYPNGKILRYISGESFFIKSFDTSAALISSLDVLNNNVFAAADEDVFMFDGKRWLFTASAGTGIITDMIQVGDSILMIVGNKIIKTSITQAITSPTERSICAYVRFRDGAGNVTRILDDSGNVIKCYNPCTLDDKTGSTTTVTTTTTTTGTTSDSTSTTTTGGTANSKLPPLVHRLTEFDDSAFVIDIFNGSESFFSGDKVTQDIGIYESEVFNGTTSLVQWVNISWYGNTPTGTSITLAVRSGKTKSELLEATWSDEFTSPTANDITNQMGQFLQFRATLIVSQPGVQSPELYKVDVQLRTSQSVHFFTTNFVLPDNLKRGILTYNGCINPPVTDIVFGISGQDSVDFSEYYPIVPNKVFELPSEQQRKNLRVGIKLISSPQSVPVVDEFALLFSLANDAIIRLNLEGMPGETFPEEISGDTRTVTIETVQGHSHTITFSVSITEETAISGRTSINAGHSHDIINGIVQISAGHTHNFEI